MLLPGPVPLLRLLPLKLFSLANKCDMEEKRMISTARGQEVATANNIKFYETSAKNNQNISDAFVTLAEDILTKVSRDFRKSSLA